MATARARDVDLYYEIHGDGSPLVLVAGIGSDSQTWLPVIPLLADGHTVIVYDNRGTGRTEPKDAAITIPVLADDCAALIGSLGYSRVDLVGHSMGGFVAQACAARHPEVVRRLILVGTAHEMSKRNVLFLRDMVASLEAGTDPARWFRDFFRWLYTRRFFEDESVVDEALRYVLEYPYPQSPDQFRRQAEALLAFAPVDPRRISAETMILTGAEDLLFPPDEGRQLAGELPNATFEVIPSAAHSMQTESPGALAEAILRFLSREV